MGDDFNYQDALTNFKNMDKIVKGFKDFPQYFENKLINVFYSTPSCYVKAVNENATPKGVAFPLKTDDFFPYASDPHTYWTGYYTSRPTSKRFERQANNILQVTKQLASFFKQSENKLNGLRKLQEAMGIMQHHDAITGTEKQHVADDYHRILTKAIQGSLHTVNNLLPLLLITESSEVPILNLQHCLLANVSICEVSQLNEFIAVVYNPLSRPVSHYVRLPVQSPNLQVEGPNGEVVPSEILPSIDLFSHLSADNPAPLELVFLADDIPALGAKLYKVAINNKKATRSPLIQRNSVFSIGDSMNGVDLDPSTGLLQSSRGSNLGFDSRASGAYIFRPHPDHPEAKSFDRTINITTYIGDLVDEIHQTFSTWATQVIRLYKNTNYVEFDWLVGPIDVDDLNGREVISRFSTNLNTDDIFYTDSNGREMIQRRRDHRNTYTYTSEEKVSGNYYPVTSKIVLKDPRQNLEFAVLNDRAQGGSSLTSGQVELMVHRRLLNDDAFGVGEALNEMQYGMGLIARGQHYVTFGPSSVSYGKSSAAIQRDIAQQKLLAPLTFVSSATDLWIYLKKEFAGLTRNLPDNVQLLTLEPWRSSDNTLLLRLEHVLEKDEDHTLSMNATVDLNGLFTYFDIVSIQEMTLDGNQPLHESERLEWVVGNEFKYYYVSPTGRKTNYTQAPFKYNMVDLSPMQIRTFLLTVTYV
ncbi:Glycosyl hydrolases family 38 C-terminal beta sandwich domain [Popillia japonica]|uniref:Glycosyl hydrolases family 38 C-terminal beta sandwich domain n=1 Tax=Popillia japonica TaxID=7064 RepID=A0AAW1ITP5_POPJA